MTEEMFTPKNEKRLSGIDVRRRRPFVVQLDSAFSICSAQAFLPTWR